MEFDYRNPEQVVNFRDVGLFVNTVTGTDLLPVGRLFRGGTLRYVGSLDVVSNPKTILNLRKGPDSVFEGVENCHFPISNDYEKFETSTPEVRTWLRGILAKVSQGIQFPL
jgi:protein-tyrosine phosphatase